jgi:hypothetical protein
MKDLFEYDMEEWMVRMLLKGSLLPNPKNPGEDEDGLE